MFIPRLRVAKFFVIVGPLFFFIFPTFFFLVLPWGYFPRVDAVVSLMGMGLTTSWWFPSGGISLPTMSESLALTRVKFSHWLAVVLRSLTATLCTSINVLPLRFCFPLDFMPKMCCRCISRFPASTSARILAVFPARRMRFTFLIVTPGAYYWIYFLFPFR